ncbi:MAG: hypothetical protein ACYCSF_04550 [Acidimicrobiales bacterium]
MDVFRITKRRIAATVAGGALLLGGGSALVVGSGGVANAAPLAPSAPAHSVHRGVVGRHRLRSLLHRADYATAEVKVKGQWVTLTMDKGAISAVSSQSIVVARPDGHSATLDLGPNTRYRGAATSESGLHSGELVMVVSEGGTARVVFSHNAS